MCNCPEIFCLKVKVSVLITALRKQLQMYREWFARWHSFPVVSWITAAELYQKGEFEAASKLYLAGLKSQPNSPAVINAILDLAHCLFRMKRFEESEQYLRRATVIAPHEREAYVRLARLQLWLGHASEALWTMRMCMKKVTIDPELATLFATAVVESKSSASVVAEAQQIVSSMFSDGGFPRLEVARARLGLLGAHAITARDDLSKLASIDRGPFEAVVAFAEVLLEEGKISYARHHLQRALAVAPEHPRVLRLLAAVYLREGAFFHPDYAVQLASKACQVTDWRGVHELLMLAHAYIAANDKTAALLVATRAKDVIGRLLGTYPEIERLDQLLHDVSAESQA
jgi:uncharacterized protein HemY